MKWCLGPVHPFILRAIPAAVGWGQSRRIAASSRRVELMLNHVWNASGQL